MRRAVVITTQVAAAEQSVQAAQKMLSCREFFLERQSLVVDNGLALHRANKNCFFFWKGYTMNRARFLLGIVVVAVLVGGGLYGQDTKGKAKLPRGWAKLNLSDDQRKQVSAVYTKYGPQITELQQKLDDLRKQEQTELNKILTADQRNQLREAALKKVPPAEGESKKEK